VHENHVGRLFKESSGHRLKDTVIHSAYGVHNTSAKSLTQRSTFFSLRQLTLRDSVGQICLACILFLSLVALLAVLMYLIYLNIMSTNHHSQGLENSYSITENNQSHPIRANKYYIAYSATRLAFILSLSSTLALALLPVGMGIFRVLDSICSMQSFRPEKHAKATLTIPI